MMPAFKKFLHRMLTTQRSIIIFKKAKGRPERVCLLHLCGKEILYANFSVLFKEGKRDIRKRNIAKQIFHACSGIACPVKF